MKDWSIDNYISLVSMLFAVASAYSAYRSNASAKTANEIAMKATEDARRSMYSTFNNYLNRVEIKFKSFSENFYDYKPGYNYKELRNLNEFLKNIIESENGIVYPIGYEKVFDEIYEQSVEISLIILTAFNFIMSKKDIEKVDEYMNEAKYKIDELISHIAKTKTDLQQP